MSYEEYHSLLVESEYAAWMAAFGFRPNHFTVFINALERIDSVEEVNDPLMRKVRYMDKLVDELTKGRPLDKILRA